MNNRESRLSYKECLKGVRRNDVVILNTLLTRPVEVLGFDSDQLTQLMLEAMKSGNATLVRYVLNSNSVSKIDISLIAKELKYLRDAEMVRILLNFLDENDYIKDIDRKLISDLGFLPGRGELINIILKSSHRIGLSGNLEIDDSREVKLEGNDPVYSAQYLDESVRQYADINEEFNHIHGATHFSHIVRSCINDKRCLSDLFKDRVDSGGLIISSVGWKGHAIGLAIQYDKSTNKTYISISNRGDGSLDACIANDEARNMINKYGENVSGTIVYEMNGTLPIDFYSGLQIGTYVSNVSMSDFSQRIAEHLSSARPLAVLNAGDQAHGTCTYVNSKRSIEGVILISKILEGRTVNDQLLTEVYDDYKRFSLHDKSSACEQVLNEYMRAKEKNNISAILSLEKLMMSIIVEHQSNKHNGAEIRSSRLLYDNLPNTQKLKIKPFLSQEFLQYNMSQPLNNEWIFTRPSINAHKNNGEVNVTYVNIHGSFEIVNRVNMLRQILNEKNLTSKDVEIHCDGDTVLLRFPSLDNWPIIKDVLIKDLGAKLEKSETGIYIKNINEMRFPEMVNDQEISTVHDKKRISLTAIKKMIANNDFTTENLKYLLANGVEVNHRFRDGSTILHILVANGLNDSVNFLLGLGANPMVRDTVNNITPLDIAFIKKDRIIGRCLANALNDQNSIPALHMAVKAGNIDMVEFLLDSGLSPNSRLKTGDTPLHIAVGVGNTSIVKLLIEGRYGDVDINQPMPNGITPLAIAALSGDVAMVKLLVDNGAILKEPLMLSYSNLFSLVGDGRKSKEYFSEFTRRAGNDTHIVTVHPIQFAKMCGSSADVINKLTQTNKAMSEQAITNRNGKTVDVNNKSREQDVTVERLRYSHK